MNIASLIENFPDLDFRKQVPLAPFTYMNVGGMAEAFISVKSQEELFTLCSFCFRTEVEFVVLGGASNVIIPDEGLAKLVIRNQAGEIKFGARENNLQKIVVDSGVITALLANKTMEMGLTGLECFVGVPGTIGGAIVNNSHFSATELIGNLITEVVVCTSKGEREVWPKEKLDFDYDHSIFHEQVDVILGATFVLAAEKPEVIRQNVKTAALKRTSTQPIGIPSSGCMYQNPIVTDEEFRSIGSKLEFPSGASHLRTDGRYQIAAGFLIDQAGLKGAKVGGAAVSEKHATYMVNTGGATSHDIEALCLQVEKTVLDKFGVKLEREVFFLK